MSNTEKSVSSMNINELGAAVENAKKPTGKDGLNAVLKEIKERNKTPSHEELMETYKGAYHDEKVEQTIVTLKRFMQDAGVENLAQATRVAPDENIDLTNVAVGKVRVFYKQVTREQTRGIGLWRKTEKVATNEVLVVAVRKNDNDPNKNTVVTAVVRHNKGVPQIAKNKDGLFATRSETEFNDTLHRNPPNAQSNLLEGKSTLQAFKAQFRKENGITHEQYWKRWDEKRDNDPDYWNTDKKRDENLSRLEGRYAELLERAQKRRSEILTETKRLIDEAAAKRNEVLGSEVFRKLMSTDKTDQITRRALAELIMRTYNIDEKQLKEIMK